MGRLKILDCTLCDGSYINDWRFWQTVIQNIIRQMEATGAEIVELGFLKDKPYDPNRTVFRLMDQVKEIIGHKRPGVDYACNGRGGKSSAAGAARLAGQR